MENSTIVCEVIFIFFLITTLAVKGEGKYLDGKAMFPKISVFNEEMGKNLQKNKKKKKKVFYGSKSTVKRTEAAWFEIILTDGSP